MTTESVDGWMRRIGSKEALAQRQAERLAATLNKRLPPPWGFRNFVVALMKTRPHALSCQCAKCVPYPVQPVLKLPDQDAPARTRTRWQQRGRSGN